MDIIFDIDKTICDCIKEDHKNYYIGNLIPNEDMIRKINHLYDMGHKIIFLTGRGAITGIDWKEETEKQLKIWGVKYHELKFIKKPLEYLYVDDKACSPKEFMEKY
jgi:hypothetical protein